MLNYNTKNKEIAKKKKRKKGYVCRITITGVIVFVLILCGIIGCFCEKIRLDQYSITILSTTAGIVGTMFGLTAASYAFIWEICVLIVKKINTWRRFFSNTAANYGRIS